MKISNYTTSYDALTRQYRANYTLHIPPAHCANGTDKEIQQEVQAVIVFNPNPALVMYGKTIPILNPVRFGSWGNHDERSAYLHSFISDTAKDADAP